MMKSIKGQKCGIWYCYKGISASLLRNDVFECESKRRGNLLLICFWGLVLICQKYLCPFVVHASYFCLWHIWNVVLVLTYVMLEIHLNFFGTLNPNNPMEFIRVVPLSFVKSNIDDTFCEDKEGELTYFQGHSSNSYTISHFPGNCCHLFTIRNILFSHLPTCITFHTHKQHHISHHLSFPLYFIYNIIIIDSGCNFCQT